jgi:O-antigen ligase
LKESVVTKYAVLGSGFGQPFMSYDFAVYINETIHSAIMIDDYYPMARYLSPPHNSWLSFVFHIGLLPALLFLVPLKNVGLTIMLSPLPANRNKSFLLLAFAGCFIWVAFNVILELPHSAVYFWLIYFTTAYAFKYRSQWEI